MSLKQNIEEFIIEKPRLTIWIFSIILLFVGGFSYLVAQDKEIPARIVQVSVILFIFTVLWKFWIFFTGEGRLQHQFNAFHASSLLSAFYRIYFPIIILSILIQFIIGFALIPEDQSGWGVIDPDISPSGYIVFIISSIVVGLGLILFTDLDMKKKRLRYSSRRQGMGFLSSLFYTIPLMGIYFGLTFFTRFLITQAFGLVALFPTTTDFYKIDSFLIQAARFWIFLTKDEQQLTLLAFITLYIGLEFLLRGLLANEAESYGLGAGGIVFVPAVIQAFAFSSGNFVFTDPIYYLYTLIDAFIFGLILGITLWRTGRFGAVLFLALITRVLDNRLDFQVVILKLLPQPFGDYDPADGIITQADQIGDFFIIIQILLVIFGPFIMLVYYDESWSVLQGLWNNLRKQWFGYLVLGFAFFLIDLIFSQFAGPNPLFPLLGFILALLIIGFVLNYLFKLLPPATDISAMFQSKQYEIDLVVDVSNDIQYLERTTKWYENPYRMAIASASLYLYILFISAAYRQYSVLDQLESLKFTLFLIFIPTILIGFSGYLISRSIKNGFFFAENWRNSFTIGISIFYVIFIYRWAVSSSLAEFSWRTIPLFLPFLFLLFPKPNRTPVANFNRGLSSEGRISTFKNVEYSPKLFLEHFDTLQELSSENSVVGVKILAAKLNLLEEWNLIELLRKPEITRADKIGNVMALGLIGSQSSEGVLLKLLEEDDLELKIASYWALGKIGSERSLGRMAQLLEEDPRRKIIPIAEKAILSIDPNYPLAGLRDNIVIEQIY